MKGIKQFEREMMEVLPKCHSILEERDMVGFPITVLTEDENLGVKVVVTPQVLLGGRKRAMAIGKMVRDAFAKQESEN